MSDNNQRVNIAYSVGLEEIPKEVNRLLDKLLKTLQKEGVENIQDIKSTISQDENYMSASEKIDNVRKTLGLVDHMLHDCYGIILAYRKIHLEKDEEQMSLDLQDQAPPSLGEEELSGFDIDSLIAHPNFEQEAMKIAEKMRQQAEEADSHDHTELKEVVGNEKG